MLQTTHLPSKPAGAAWSQRGRVVTALTAFVIYTCLVLLAGIIYYRNLQLDRLSRIATETEQIIDNLHDLNLDVALKEQRIAEALL